MDTLEGLLGLAVLIAIVAAGWWVQSRRRRRMDREERTWRVEAEARGGAAVWKGLPEGAPHPLPESYRRWLRRVARALTVATLLAAVNTVLLVVAIFGGSLGLPGEEEVTPVLLIVWWSLLAWWAFGAWRGYWSWRMLWPILITVGTIGGAWAELTLRPRIREAWGPLRSEESRLAVYGL